MLQPKRTKFRKFHKGKAEGIKENNPSGTALSFGTYGINVFIPYVPKESAVPDGLFSFIPSALPL